jgi:hypothetical protein
MTMNHENSSDAKIRVLANWLQRYMDVLHTEPALRKHHGWIPLTLIVERIMDGDGSPHGWDESFIKTLVADAVKQLSSTGDIRVKADSTTLDIWLQRCSPLDLLSEV